MALPDTLTNKIGGQPVYVWIGGGVVIIGGVVWYRKRKGATSQGTDTVSYDTTAMSDGYSMPTGSAGGSVSAVTSAAGGQPGGMGSTAPVPVPTGTQPDNSKDTAKPGKAVKAAKEFPSGTVLRQGSTGNSVKALQRLLTNAGFSPGVVDGVYGSQTARAVKSYQRSRGLSVDAVAGTETLGALMASKAPVTHTTQSSGASASVPKVPATPKSKITKVTQPLKGLGAGGFTQKDRDRAAGKKNSDEHSTDQGITGFLGDLTAPREDQSLSGFLGSLST